MMDQHLIRELVLSAAASVGNVQIQRTVAVNALAHHEVFLLVLKHLYVVGKFAKLAFCRDETLVFGQIQHTVHVEAVSDKERAPTHLTVLSVTEEKSLLKQ